MEQILSILGIILIMIAFMLLGVKSLAAAIRRRVPHWDDEAEMWLLWGLLGISGLGCALVVAYLLTRP